MSLFHRLADWLDIRPDEIRKLNLLFAGAFVTISFMILARALREGLYLSVFPVETLPYITITVAVLSVPTVGVFAKLLARRSPRRVVMGVSVVQAAGLVLIWPFAELDVAIVAFYIWTTLGTLLLTSGFWVVSSELFPVRGAKRTFGLIGAGGTLGAMVTGNSLVWLTREFPLPGLFALLIGILALFLLSQASLPEPRHALHASEPGESTTVAESFRLAWRSPHLRTVTLIVAGTGIAATLLDYQFKDLLQANLETGEQLTSFFGAFYGWTGAIALLIQIFVVSRLIRLCGLAVSLAVTPLLLLLGSIGLLILPSLVLVTLVRGSDASLRKSVYRSAVEILYVPVPASLRRKTKTFIDSVVDAAAEGAAAGLIFLWVTLGGLSARFLSIFVIAVCAALVLLSRRMGAMYFQTVTEQLKEGGEEAARLSGGADLGGRDLLSGTFTRLDIESLLKETDLDLDHAGDQGEGERTDETWPDPERVLERLNSTDLSTVARVLTENTEWDESHVPALARLLARDQLHDLASAILVDLGEAAVPHLTELLRDDDTEFVIRRRIPRVLAKLGGPEADSALLDALAANRFEVRYRAAIALVRRRFRGMPKAESDVKPRVWAAVRREVSKERPVWELQRLLDSFDTDADVFVSQRTDVRGALSLEHTFRLLTLVLPNEPVQAAFHGIMSNHEEVKSFALEYLEQVLPEDIRDRLWPFIGDVSEYQRDREIRPLAEVVSDLMTTGATLFGDENARAALQRLLEEEGYEQ